MSSQLGLDKLQLLLPASEVSFRPDFPIEVGTSYNAGTGEHERERDLFWNGEKFVKGSKAWLNNPNFHVDIVPHRENSSSLFLLHFSGGAYSDSNLQPMDNEGAVRALCGIQDDLLALGCSADLMKAQITRLDLARNVELDFPVSSYDPVFGLVQCRKRVNMVQHGPTGFYLGNKQWEFGGYDKGAEMLDKGFELAECPENTLRAEMRYKKSATVRAATGCETPKDLRKNWENFKPAFKASLERDVFKAKVEANLDRNIALDTLFEMVRRSKAKRESAAFYKHLGMMQLVMLAGPEEATRRVVEEFGYDASTETGRKQVARIRAGHAAASLSLKAHAGTATGALVKDLYRELKERVLNF